MRDLSRNIIKLIIRANSAVDKTAALTELVETCEMLKTMVFYAKEVKAFQSFWMKTVRENMSGNGTCGVSWAGFVSR